MLTSSNLQSSRHGTRTIFSFYNLIATPAEHSKLRVAIDRTLYLDYHNLCADIQTPGAVYLSRYWGVLF